MNIENFKQEVLERLSKEKQFQDCQLEINEFKKVNGVTLQGLSIAKPKDGISPVIYLDDFFQEYKSGKDFNSILSNIASTLNSIDPSDLVMYQNLSNFKLYRNKIFPKIIKTEGNEDFLKGKAYLPFLNLSILFYIDYIGNRSVDITNQMLNIWNIEINDLFEIAKQNIEMQYIFLSMNQVLYEIINEDTQSKIDKDDTMYVLSNYNRHYGAGTMVNESILQSVFHNLEQNFYILPSSVHELIIVRAMEDVEVEGLKQMVMDVNADFVDKKEILSYDLYMYDGKAQKVFIV